MAKMAASFDALCIQYHSGVTGIHNIVVLTKWNDWEQAFYIIDDIETSDFGVLDDKALDVVADGFFQYGSMIFEGTEYMTDEEIRDMFYEYAENWLTIETVIFCRWTKVPVDVNLEVSI